MFEIIVNEKILLFPTFYELENYISEKPLNEDNFLLKLKKDIESIYFGTFKHLNPEINIKVFLHSQLLIKKTSEYLIHHDESFDKYIDKWKFNKVEVDNSFNKLPNHHVALNSASYLNFNFSDTEKIDSLSFFYKLAFSDLFMERYLYELISVYPDLFKKIEFDEKSIKELIFHLFDNFKEVYDKSFERFRKNLLIPDAKHPNNSISL